MTHCKDCGACGFIEHVKFRTEKTMLCFLCDPCYEKRKGNKMLNFEKKPYKRSFVEDDTLANLEVKKK